MLLTWKWHLEKIKKKLQNNYHTTFTMSRERWPSIWYDSLSLYNQGEKRIYLRCFKWGGINFTKVALSKLIGSTAAMKSRSATSHSFKAHPEYKAEAESVSVTKLDSSCCQLMSQTLFQSDHHCNHLPPLRVSSLTLAYIVSQTQFTWRNIDKKYR